MSISNTPPEKTYWVVPGTLLAGEYPRNKDLPSSLERLNQYIRLGISYFIDLTEHGEWNLEPYAHLLRQWPNREIQYQRFPIPDAGIPKSKHQVIAILDTIDRAIVQGHMVYVHCWGGIGRTGTIVGCYFARHGTTGQPALDQLRQHWRHCTKSGTKQCPETPKQIQFILDWYETARSA